MEANGYEFDDHFGDEDVGEPGVGHVVHVRHFGGDAVVVEAEDDGVEEDAKGHEIIKQRTLLQHPQIKPKLLPYPQHSQRPNSNPI